MDYYIRSDNKDEYKGVDLWLILSLDGEANWNDDVIHMGFNDLAIAKRMLKTISAPDIYHEKPCIVNSNGKKVR